MPAYRGAFLAEHAIAPGVMRSPADFARLPLVTKANYPHRYTLADLCRRRHLAGCDFVAVSSGSTGQPTFWPRFVADVSSRSRHAEQVFRDSFHADERRTLAVVCFALGTWLAACLPLLAAVTWPPRAT
ncbi:MAG: hypothetical protein U0Z44_03510 [Kouleothrix sp.]